MDFNKLVYEKLGPIFQIYNLHIVEQFENYIKLESSTVVITISHDKREKSNLISVGRSNDFLYPLDDNVILGVFNLDLKINYATPENFVNMLSLFFESEGTPLLKGDPTLLSAIERYVQKKSSQYTTQLVDRQNLEAANKAWQEGNYKDFIDHIDRVERVELPSSYELKYKIAHQKLKSN